MHDLIDRDGNILDLSLLLVLCVNLDLLNIEIFRVVGPKVRREQVLLEFQVLADEAGPALQPDRRVVEAGLLQAIPLQSFDVVLAEFDVEYGLVYQVIPIYEGVIVLHDRQHLLVIREVQVLAFAIFGTAKADGFLPLFLGLSELYDIEKLIRLDLTKQSFSNVSLLVKEMI